MASMPMQQRVLVVEDDETIRAWLEVGLASEGWAVQSAEDGSQALRLLCGETEHFDLVLLDIWLPEMNGLEVLRAVRAFGIECPVIVMTAYDESFDRDHALQLGAADVLVKPFDVADFTERARQLVA